MSDDSVQPTETTTETDRVSRLSGMPPLSAGDEVVREYEARYTELPRKTIKPRSYSTMNVSDEERLWAAAAHASIWITALGGLFTIGFIVPASVFIPLVIYFLFRKRSDYVAFHALQAFVLQLLATVGMFALLVVGGLAWLIGLVVALLAVFLLVGIILVPLWGLVGIALLLVVFLGPLVALLFGTIATIETYHRRDYRYPVIARWVDRQLAGGFLNTTA